MIYKWSVKTFVTLALLVILFAVPAPKARAFEPITMSIIAAIVLPYAIKFVKAATPYVIKGAINFGKGMVDVFVDMCGFGWLPFGLMESTFGAPFGLFGRGVENMGYGSLAPFRAMWSMMKLPVRIFTG